MANNNLPVRIDPKVGMEPVRATRDNVATMERFIILTLTGDKRANAREIRALAVIAVKFGLHPLANEVMLYEGRPFITINGRRRLAERSGQLNATQPQIVTDRDERAALGGRRPGDIVARCQVYRKGSERPTVQYGIVRAHERWPSENEASRLGIDQTKLNEAHAGGDPDKIFDLITNPTGKARPVVIYPEIMAMKRAESRALDGLASIGLPTFDEEIGAPLDNGGPLPPGLTTPDEALPPPAEAEVSAEDMPPDVEEEPQQEMGEREYERRTGRKPRPPKSAPAKDPPTTIEELMMLAVKELGYTGPRQVAHALGLEDVSEIRNAGKAWADLKKLGPLKKGEEN